MNRLVLALLPLGLFAQQPTLTPAPIARLQANIERITKSINADWGIYIKCLETGEEIAMDADKQMDTITPSSIHGTGARTWRPPAAMPAPS